jgi:hypothetical protein
MFLACCVAVSGARDLDSEKLASIQSREEISVRDGARSRFQEQETHTANAFALFQRNARLSMRRMPSGFTKSAQSKI